MSCGQLTSPLRWLPELSSTTPIGPSPNSWRRWCRKSSRHWPSTVGNTRKTPVPVVGSTAAYSHSHSYSSCTIKARTFPHWTPAPTQPSDQAKAGITRRPRAAAAVVALPGSRRFFKDGLLLCIRLLVSSAPGLPLDPMFLEEPPVLLAVLVADAPLALQIIARILHGHIVSRSHRLHQARPRLCSQPRGLPCRLLPLEHPCQALCPIAFPPARQLAHTVADQRCTVLQTLHRSAFHQAQHAHPIRCFLSS